MTTKVLGIGNALVDTMTQIDSDDLLQKFLLPKGSMQLVDTETIKKVGNGTAHCKKSLSSGGSVANTMHGLGKMGASAGYIGKIGEDETGKVFRTDMTSNNIDAKLLVSKSTTGQAIALVSPDSERTFAVYLGAAIEMTADDLVPQMFDGYQYFHIEGYLVQNHSLLLQAAKLAKAKGVKISIDLASFNVVEANLEFLKSYVKEYADIVFANEEEAKAFTGKDPEAALNEIAQMCEIAIVKVGKNGSMIKRGNEVVNVGVIPVKSIDTTGAGDLYASGFFYGLTKNLPLKKCGEIGAVLSGNVIEVIGSKMDDERWKKIHSRVKEIIG